MRAAAALGAGAALLLAGHAGAAGMHDGAGAHASVLFASFAPRTLTTLVGDSVSWQNDSLRPHTVSAEDDGFDSGRLPPGATFTHRFDRPGVQLYFCRLHTSMRGTVDIREVLLDPPTEPTAPGRPYRLTGRAALPAGTDLAVESDEGGGFRSVGTVRVGEGGTLRSTLTPRHSAAYRVAAAGGESNTVRLLVLDRRLEVHATTRARRARVAVRVLPASPGATVVLQLRLREHFGWWPVARARVGRDGSAGFRIPIGRRVPARVVLTLEDGATRLTTSRTVHVGARRARP